MPKMANNSPKYKGKVGDMVHVDSPTYGHHVRKAAAPGARKRDVALRTQQLRNKQLNGMAGMIKSTIKAGFPKLFRTNLYHRIVKLVKKEPGNSRSFCMLRLRGMEINEQSKLKGEGRLTFSIKKIKQTITLELTLPEPYSVSNIKSNCYKNDLILFTWCRNDKPALISRKDTEWIYTDKQDKKVLTAAFKFTCPAGTVHWLLALRQKLGFNGREDAAQVFSFKAEAAQFIGSGSFDKKEQALLNKRYKEICKETAFKFRNTESTLAVSETVKIE